MYNANDGCTVKQGKNNNKKNFGVALTHLSLTRITM